MTMGDDATIPSPALVVEDEKRLAAEVLTWNQSFFRT